MSQPIPYNLVINFIDDCKVTLIETDYSMFPQSKSTRITIFLLIIFSLLPLIIATRHHTYLNDDTYITLTFVKNLAQGNGFVYNHPPEVLGTTTPLLTIVLTFLVILMPWFDPVAVAVFFTAFCWLGILWLFFLFRQDWELRNWQVVILSLVIVLLVWQNYLGMEAYLFAFLLVLSISLFLNGRYLLCGVAVGLLFLTRGEGILLLFLLPAWYAFTRLIKGELIIKPAVTNIAAIFIGFCIIVVPWFIYAQITFGAILPNTLAAKQAQAQNVNWRPFWFSLLFDWIPQWSSANSLQFLSISIWWPIIVFGITAMVLRMRRWLLFVAWILLYIVGYSVLGVTGYEWYQLPILFVMQLIFALGIIEMIDLAGRTKKRFYQPVLFLIGVVIILLSFSRPAVDVFSTFEGDFRGESYTRLSRWIQQNTDRDESIAFIEIGYIGYYTDNQIIDLSGLILPDIIPQVAQGDFSFGIWEYEPDYLIYRADFDFLVGDIRNHPEFNRTYQPVATLPGPLTTDLIIYKRK